MCPQFLKQLKFQIFLVCCGIVFIGCLLLAHSGPRHWTARTSLQIFDEEDSSAPEVAPVKSNIPYLTSLLRDRLTLPNDALRINYRSPCREHEDDVQPCVEEGCASLADKPLEERIQDLVLSPQFELSDEQLKNVLEVVSNIPEADVIISSASSRNHFYEMQSMFHSLHETVYPVLKNFTVVLFDLGLKKRQRKLAEKFCRCQVVSFPFELFPAHVSNLLCYSWKAIIIRALITKARQVLVWQDSSIRWTKNFPVIFERALRYGQQFLQHKRGARITANTHQLMFSYMKEEICLYHTYREIQCGLQVMKNDLLVVQAVLNPWTRCALEESCICPVDPETVIECKKDTNSTLHRCHRFDQSAMSILLSKLYAADRYRIIIPEFSNDNPKYVQIKRGDKIRDYFSIH
ncbi:hypothetical protein PoB_000601600 [Plakobranchus ocellatus]|uniref:Uncharacterized protein n=1 Tax=Plakobranchus ocellatus TaxID=259542 RepID=A0AAV3YAT4_9GAST|nr:hypothetical protein PoB_000601600 [Plakobranchus ocellatus]